MDCMHADRIISMSEEDANGLFKIAKSLFEKGDYGSALYYFHIVEPWAEKNVDDKSLAVLYFMSGFSLLNEKKIDEAFYYANKALSRCDEPVFHMLRGYAEYAFGDSAASVRDLSIYIDSSVKQNADALFLRGLAYQNLGDWSKSAADFEKVVELDNSSSALFYYLGVSLANANEDAKSIESFKKALELDPSFGTAYVEEAKILLKNNLFKEVHELVESARSHGADNENLHLYNAIAYAKSGFNEEASVELLTVRGLSADFDSKAIDLLNKMGNYAGVAVIFMKWANAYPHIPGFYKLEMEAVAKAAISVPEEDETDLYDRLQDKLEELSDRYLYALDSETEMGWGFEDLGTALKKIESLDTFDPSKIEDALEACDSLIEKYASMPGPYKLEAEVISKLLDKNPKLLDEKPELLEKMLRDESSKDALLDTYSNTAS